MGALAFGGQQSLREHYHAESKTHARSDYQSADMHQAYQYAYRCHGKSKKPQTRPFGNVRDQE